MHDEQICVIFIHNVDNDEISCIHTSYRAIYIWCL